MCVRRPRFLAVHGIRLAPSMFSDQITMRTTRDAGGPRARAGWWRTLGFLGAALVLPGGLVLLLFLLLARAAGVAVVLSSSHRPNGSQRART